MEFGSAIACDCIRANHTVADGVSFAVAKFRHE
jgi:hypothetical protein